jgi:hypothetical protein
VRLAVLVDGRKRYRFERGEFTHLYISHYGLVLYDTHRGNRTMPMSKYFVISQLSAETRENEAR